MCYNLQSYTSDFVMKKNKSFMKMFKRIGPRIEPCGTPVLMSHHELKDGYANTIKICFDLSIARVVFIPFDDIFNLIRTVRW